MILHFVQKINEKVVVVVDYESGRALPNQQIISKLERALGKNSIALDVLHNNYGISSTIDPLNYIILLCGEF